MTPTPTDRLEQLWLKLEADELAQEEVPELVALLRQDPQARRYLVQQARMSTVLAAGPGLLPAEGIDATAGGDGGSGFNAAFWGLGAVLMATILGGLLWWGNNSTEKPSLDLAFNFAPINIHSSRIVPGMIHDIHEAYSEERGYGWLDELERRYRSGRPSKQWPLAYATVVYVGDAENTSTFAVKLDNGDYLVEVVVGWAFQGPHRVVVEGQRFMDGELTTQERPFIVVERRIAIQDGRLEIELGTDDGPPNVGTKDIDTGLVSLRIRSYP